MKLVIASGKGGTGKTTVAVNLAAVMAGPVTYVDCDVEEPNGHLFLKPVIETANPVGIPVPVVDPDTCTGCGRCAEVCCFHAVACINKKVLVFPEMCHGCGGCMLTCPEHAISEVQHEIGRVETGYANNVGYIGGTLKVGTAMAPPLIRAVKQCLPQDGVAVIDAPPGTSCPVIATLRDADFVLLVTEPTPFGLHDLMLAVDMVRALDVPFGVLVNRVGVGDDRVHAYCEDQHIPLLMEIPDDRKIAEAYSRGTLIVDALPEYRELFTNLLEMTMAMAKGAESIT